jgi:hypothetical protein
LSIIAVIDTTLRQSPTDSVKTAPQKDIAALTDTSALMAMFREPVLQLLVFMVSGTLRRNGGTVIQKWGTVIKP